MLFRSGIVARKVASIPISWPLLTLKLLGANFSATNIQNNKLLKALLGPSTIDALISPNDSKAALMLGLEVAAVAIMAATLGMGSLASLALLATFAVTDPASFGELFSPDTPAQAANTQAANANRQANRQAHAVNNSNNRRAALAGPQVV